MTGSLRSVRYTPIGIIHSPLKEPIGAPIQAVSAKNIEGTVEVFPPYERGLKDIAGFSHIILIYHFHKSRKLTSLTVKPFLEKRDKEHGVFSTRAPVRPNSIGISIVRLEGIRKRKLYIRDVDIVDGTPLLDIKPFVPGFDCRKTTRIGWYSSKIQKLPHTIADDRFVH